ncbi:sugar phosphate nucleotidyltransferase [Arcticibacter pallidicorallinus]|nr:sugar phosphate nucleotidyltransferase [Arcticibacter pallidicorallinus]
MNNVLIMAGGRSSRMRNTTSLSLHKALAPIFGIPLIELNLLYAYVYGYRQAWVSVAATEQQLLTHLDRLKKLYRNKLGLIIQIIVEEIPLGTIGAAQFVDIGDDDVLVLNVDNLLNLDLSVLENSHISSRAVMTIASHYESFSIPFGQLVVEEGEVVDYLEKPKQRILVSSGTYILGPKARSIVSQNYPEQRIDIPGLSKDLIALGDKVHSFLHQSIWSDINDKDTLERVRESEKWPLIDKIQDLIREVV